MNKRATNFLTNEVAYIIFLVLAIALTFAVVWKYQDNASNWQDYYSKELVRVIDSGQAGDNITFNVQKGTEIAKKNGLDIQANTLFKFDSKNHNVCVSLSKGNPTCYSYFKDLVIVTDAQPIEFGVPDNVLHFSIVLPSSSVNSGSLS